MALLGITFDSEVELLLSNEIDSIDFTCHQPDFINGIYAGSGHVLIDATELPDGLRIYLNTGESGTVKDARCLIKLDSPLISGNVIFCYVKTDKCNVQSCEYVVGEYISGDFGCIEAPDVPPNGSQTGELVCFGTDLHRMEYNEFGKKVVGIAVQEDCYICGGNEPSCE